MALERAALGSMNEVWIVGSPPRYVLRGHRHADEAQVDFEHAVMGVARAGGIPVPATVVTRAGARFATVDGRHWSLLTWLPGEHAVRGAISVARAASMGTTLASVHDALVTVQPIEPPDRRVEPTAEVVARIDVLLDVVDDEAVLASLRDRRGWLLDQPDEAPAPPPDVQVVHGDYHDGNVLFNGDDVVAVIDWDKAEARSATEELLRCAHLSFQLDPATTDAFLDAYRARRHVSDVDLDAAVARYGYERNRSLWLVEEAYLRGNQRVQPFLDGPFTPFAAAWAER